jgi:hypothetical protein
LLGCLLSCLYVAGLCRLTTQGCTPTLGYVHHYANLQKKKNITIPLLCCYSQTRSRVNSNDHKPDPL